MDRFPSTYCSSSVTFSCVTPGCRLEGDSWEADAVAENGIVTLVVEHDCCCPACGQEGKEV